MRTSVVYSLLLIVAVVFLFPSSGWPQSTSVIQRVTGKDKAIIIRERGKDHTYNFEDDLQLYEIEQAKLLFQNRVNGKLYLLMYVEGSSTGGGNGQCGAGQEEYLIWQALDSKWAQDDYRVELIASCFVDVGAVGPEPYESRQGQLTAEYFDSRDNVANTLTYDSTKPEKGWTIQKKPTPTRP